jgi:hypothetical protein
VDHSPLGTRLYARNDDAGLCAWGVAKSPNLPDGQFRLIPVGARPERQYKNTHYQSHAASYSSRLIAASPPRQT